MARNNLYTHERWNAVDERNKRLMQFHVRNMKIEKLRPNSIHQYSCDLRMFMVWNLLYNDNMYLIDFTKMHFDEFKFFMIEERNASNARVDRLISAIRQMMDYAEGDDLRYKEYEHSKAAKVKSLGKGPVRDIVFLTEKQIVMMRDYLMQKKMFKLMFLLDLFYDSGGRISEILQVKNVESLVKGYTNKVELKGGEMGYLLLHDRAKESLKIYLNAVGDNEYIWLKKNGDYAKNESTIRDWVKKLRHILTDIQGKETPFTPHSFRHTVIENMCNGTHYLCEKIGRPFTLEEVQLIVHHKTTDMTKSYRKPRDNEVIFGLFGISLD